MNTFDVELRGWVLYDGECRLCVASAQRFGPALERLGLGTLPLQSAFARGRLKLEQTELLKEMKLLMGSGQVYGGARAVIEIVRLHPLLKPLASVLAMPPFFALLDAGYRFLAARRNCASGACRLDLRPSRPLLPVWLLPVAAATFRGRLDSWWFMWLLSASLYFAFKWTMLCVWERQNAPLRSRDALAYLFLWFGMDPGAFALRQVPRHEPLSRPLLKALAGALLVVVASRLDADPLARGWLAMTGTVLFLHFGLFEVAAVLWRRHGVPVESLMKTPLAADSMSDFWARRWNTAFRQIAHTLVFRPTARRRGASVGAFAVFAFSGLVHELAISFSARGGWGGPVAYFLIQWVGLVLERRLPDAPALKRVWTWLWVLIPAPLLFQKRFIEAVLIPMLDGLKGA